MKILPLLLRLVLCVCLIVNGVGTAHASMRMQVVQPTHTVGSSPAGAMADAQVQAHLPPCHHRGSSVRTGAAHAAQAPALQPLHEPVERCCEDGACSCACAHAFCPPRAGWALAAGSPAVTVVAVAVIDRPQPRLPHLIRPPIR